MVRLVIEIIMLSYCVVTIVVVITLALVNNGKNKMLFQKKQVVFKVQSLIFVLLRTIGLTYCILFLARHLIMQSSSFNLVEICLICSTFLLLMTITYFQAHFFNLPIPNTCLPWSESNAQSFLIEVVSKFFLALAFTFRDSLYVRLAFSGISAVSLAIKIYMRIRVSVMFNRYVFLAALLIDTYLMHNLIFVLPAELFRQPKYWVISTLMVPILWIFIGFFIKHFKEDWTVKFFEEHLSGNDTLYACLNMYHFY